MGENYCPVCGVSLPVESINLSEGVALCAACGKLSRLADVARLTRPIQEILESPPPGCTISEWGPNTTIRVSLRSARGFLGLLAVSLFWNGIVSIFLVQAVGRLYQHLIGPLPDWFPIADGLESLGETIFLCLFLVPFVSIGAVMLGAMLLNVIGRIEVSLGRSEAKILTGVGILSWPRRFDPNQVSRVSSGVASWQQNDQNVPLIVIEADRRIKFGSLLREECREWLQAVLQDRLVHPRSTERHSLP